MKTNSPHSRRFSKGTIRALGATLALASAAAASPVNAQQTPRPDATEARPKVGCLRGQPLPACKSFWIVEMQGTTALLQTSRVVSYGGGYETATDAFEERLEWNLGHMVNLTPTFALGGTFTVGNGNTDALTGVRLRARRWMSRDISVEGEGGLLRTTAGGATYPGVTGVTAGLRLNIRDQGSFFVRWDGVSLPEVRQTDSWIFHDPGGFHHGLSVGASAGSVPALIGTGALGLAYTVLLALWWTD